MESSTETVFVSSINLGKACIQVYDTETGTCLKSYRGESVASNTLSLIGLDEYIFCGQKDKSLLQAWKINENETLQIRFAVTGKVNALAVSQAADKFCAVGIKEKIYFYHFNTGHLFGLINNHYQDISCLKFTGCGNYLASAGEDGFVYLWSRFRIMESLHKPDNPQIQPHYVLGQHSDKVTSIDISGAGIRGILISSSLDHSCKVFDLITGHLRYNIISECGLTSCVVNAIGSQVFVGGKQGKVWGINLLPHPPNQNVQIEGKGVACHESPIHHLAITASGTSLVTGSFDGEVKVWSITMSYKKNVISHPSLALQLTLLTGRGAITNLVTTEINPEVFTSSNVECKTKLSPFVVTQSPTTILDAYHTVYLHHKKNDCNNFQELYRLAADMFAKSPNKEKSGNTKNTHQKVDDEEDAELLAQVKKLKKSNSALFKVCLKHLLGDSE